MFYLQVTRLKMSEGGSTARAETQVACMVVVMVMAFLLTWLPYAAFALSVLLDPNLYIDPVIATVPMYLAKSSTVFNPIIYIFMNRQVSQYILESWNSCSWFWGNKTLHILIQIISLLREREVHELNRAYQIRDTYKMCVSLGPRSQSTVTRIPQNMLSVAINLKI